MLLSPLQSLYAVSIAWQYVYSLELKILRNHTYSLHASYFFGFMDWGTASFTRPGKLRPISWSFKLLIKSLSLLVAVLSDKKTDIAVLEAFPRLVCPGNILTLNLVGKKLTNLIRNHYSEC